MRACVLRGKPYQCSARVWVEMRRTLPHQVRRPKQTVRARRRFGGFLHQSMVRSPAPELIAKPPQGQTRPLRNTHHMPAPRDCVAKRVNSSLWLNHRTACSRKHHARSSDCRADVPWFNDSHSDGARRLITRAGNHRSAFSKSAGPRAIVRHAPGDLRRLENIRQNLRPQIGFPEHLRRPPAVHHIKQQRPRSIRHIGSSRPGQLEAHVVFRQHDRAHTRP